MRSFALVVLTASALMLVSCEARFDWPWLNKDRDHAPSGKSATEDRAISAYTQIQLEGLGKLVLDASIPTGTLRIKADSEVLKGIQALVDGSVLRISEEGMHFNPGDIEFRVAPPADLAQITLDGMGSIEATGPLKTSAELSIVLDGMGKIDLEVDASVVNANQNGTGELSVRGKAGRVSIQADGLGKVDASHLVTTDADVQSNGVGEVLVYASDKLKVRADGLGAVRFSGSPKTTDIQTEGLTKVKAAD